MVYSNKHVKAWYTVKKHGKQLKKILKYGLQEK